VGTPRDLSYDEWQIASARAQEEQMRRDIERERADWQAFEDALEELMDTVEPLWRFGDGEGGACLMRIEERFDNLKGPRTPAPPRPKKHSRTHSRLHRLAKRDGWTCSYCDRPLTCACDPGNCHESAAVADHVLPTARGGADVDDNLVLSCWACNASKGDRTPEEWKG
jgi:hypothetical protein